MLELPKRHFYPGDKIVIAGRAVAGLYFIETGKVEIYAYHGSRRIHIAYVGPNEIIGEIGIIDKNLSSANIVVIEDLQCRFMEKRLFENYILNSDPFMHALLRLFSRRIKRILALSQHHHSELRYD